METVLDLLIDTWQDTWTMIPLLFLAYVVIEYFERRDSSDDSFFWNLQKFGPLFGALIGLLPQCGFSVLAAMLFCQHNITLGTLIAVFISTSDEAIPVLISNPDMIPSLAWILIFKLVLGVVTGFIVDKVIFPNQKIIYFQDVPSEDQEEEMDQDEQAASGCPCCYPQYPLWLSALIRTAKIYLFVFVVTFLLSGLFAWIGKEQMAVWLQSAKWLQPAAAALFGFIPNCVASVVLCQLFANGALSFPALFAGLVTNAGLGLVVMAQMERNRKWIWISMLILLISALVSGYLIMLLV
ncbi:MAG: arsenic efflux protein [Erysipelotrichaceae bacterium]|nr:arsenic efflux protein [Erysipelotrichaceae bacterium]